MTSVRRIVVVVALAWGAVGAFAPTAQAHAVLDSSDPADGAMLERAPDTLTLTLSEPVDLRASSVRVLDTSGGDVVAGDVRAAAGRTRLEVPLAENLPDGVYTVTWRVLSTVDGHVTGGAFAFGVGVSPEGAALADTGDEPSLHPLSVVGRWAIYAGMVLLVGAVVGALWLFASPPRAARALALLGIALGALGVVALAEAQRRSAGLALRDVFATSVGPSALRRLVPLALAALALLVARRRARAGWIALGVATLALIGAHVLEGHAAVGRLSWAKALAQGVHVLAVGLWVGGLVVLLAGIRRATAEVRAAAARRFSAAALWTLIVVGATGVVRALNEVGGARRLVGTTYGRIVIAKVLLLAVLVALGAVNRYRSVPRAGDRPALLRRIGTIEVVIVAGVLALTAVLASIAPARLVALDARADEARSVVVTGSDFGTTVRARLEITPGAAGLNTFEVRIVDYDTEEPVDAKRVQMTLRFRARADVEPAIVELERRSPGVWTARGGALSLVGPWEATVLVQRGGDSAEVRLPFRTRSAPQQVQVIEGEPTLYNVDVGEGHMVQLYLDPARAGTAEVHATFFEDGTEMSRLEELSLVATTPEGEFLALEPRPLSSGHFVATVTLRPGRWRFDASARAPGGDVVTAWFEQDVQP